MEASSRPSFSNPFSDPIRLLGLWLFAAVAGAVFIPSMVTPWRSGVLTPQLMRTLIESRLGTTDALLAFPIGLGALVLMFRLAFLARSFDSFGGVLQEWSGIQGTGKFKRFFVRPFVWLSNMIWDRTAPISQSDCRTAARLTFQTYLVGLFLFLAFTAGVVLVSLLVVGAVLGLIFAFMGGSGGAYVADGREEPPIVKSRGTTDWIGNKVVEHFDSSDRKVAESRKTSDWLGNRIEHRGASGEPIGESRDASDLLGEKTVHYSASGEQVGESRVHEDLLGEKAAHYSATGTEVGESRHRTDLLGGYEEHDGIAPPALIQRANEDRRRGDDRTDPAIPDEEGSRR